MSFWMVKIHVNGGFSKSNECLVLFVGASEHRGAFVPASQSIELPYSIVIA